jgi:hypothetical protein
MIVCGAVLVYGGIRAASAAPFQNLGFESAIIGTPVDFQLPASQALPYWANNNYHPGYVGYDDVALAAVAVTINDNLSPYSKPLQGNYSIFLQDGTDGTSLFDAYIAQTGDVPSNAHSLMFSTDMASYVSRLEVSLNGVAMPFTLYSTDGTVNSYWGPVKTYIGDISSFAGLEDVELRFTLKSQYPLNWSDLGAIDLDAIEFSSIVVPEPSSLVLLAVGAIGLLAYARRKRR